MTPREIHTLIRRLFYADPPGNDAWVHLMPDGHLDHEETLKLLKRYIATEEVVVHGGSASRCVSLPIHDAPQRIEEFMTEGTVRIASIDFRGQVLINQIGVGRGGIKTPG
jgi:hypothetical protein